MFYLLRKSIIPIVAVSLAACTTTTSLIVKVDSKVQCCNSMAEFKYDALPLGKAVAFVLNNESPVFGFETGKSYFKAFALQPSAQVKELRISSQPTGSIGFETEAYSQAFCARAIFLDESFNPISANDSIPKYARGFWSSAFISQFAIPENARFVVLHTNPKTYAHSAVRYTTGGGYMVGNTYVFEAGGEPIFHPCGPVADASVELL